eukprot:573654-Rhodomonas_salina.5
MSVPDIAYRARRQLAAVTCAAARAAFLPPLPLPPLPPPPPLHAPQPAAPTPSPCVLAPGSTLRQVSTGLSYQHTLGQYWTLLATYTRCQYWTLLGNRVEDSSIRYVGTAHRIART